MNPADADERQKNDQDRLPDYSSHPQGLLSDTIAE